MAGGRPRIEIDWKLLNAILQYGAPKKDCADLLSCSEDTIEKRIKEEHDCSFTVYADKKMSKTKHNLRKRMYDTAIEDGNITMMIWLSKNWLGMTDRADDDGARAHVTINIDKQDEKL